MRGKSYRKMKTAGVILLKQEDGHQDQKNDDIDNAIDGEFRESVPSGMGAGQFLMVDVKAV